MTLADIEWPKWDACCLRDTRQEDTAGNSLVTPVMLSLNHLWGYSMAVRTQPIENQPGQEVSFASLGGRAIAD